MDGFLAAVPEQTTHGETFPVPGTRAIIAPYVVFVLLRNRITYHGILVMQDTATVVLLLLMHTSVWMYPTCK